MKQKWLDLTWPQRVIIMIQAFLILLFGILYCTIGRQQVMEYRDEYLRCRTDGEVTTYSGKIDGEKAVFTVSENTVHYQLGDTAYGPYYIINDPTAVPREEDRPMNITSIDTLTGIEVRNDKSLLFRGAYLKFGTGFFLYDENGEHIISFSASNAQKVTVETGSGIMVTYLDDSEPSFYEILQVAIAPHVSQRGHFSAFVFGILICLLCVISILYADKLFRWNLRFQIRNVEDAEPSEWELFSRWIGWLALMVIALVIFILGLNAV